MMPSSSVEAGATDVREHEMRRAARERAVARVAEALQRPDQLSKVAQLKFKYYNNKVAVDTQLRNVVHCQLAEAREGADTLAASLTLLASVRQGTSLMRDLATETRTLIPDYVTVQNVNTVRQNLRATQERLNVFIQIPIKLAKIRRLMYDDADANVLKVHAHIRALERERDSVLLQAVEYPEQQCALRNMFRSVDQISDDFDAMMWRLLADHYNLALSKPAVLVKVMQVIFRESRAHDAAQRAAEQLRRLRQTAASNEDEIGAVTDPQTIRDYTTLVRKMPKLDYRSAASAVLKQSIRTRFFAAFDECRLSDESRIAAAQARSAFYGSPSALLGGYEAQRCVNASRKILVELEKVCDDVQHCFPPCFEICALTAQTYHACFYELLTKICDVSGKKENPVEDTLLLFKWIHIFYEPQLKRLAITPPEPPLALALEPLVEEHRQYVFNSIDALANLVIAMDRDTPPEMLSNALHTMAPMTLFNIVQAHLDTAIKSNAPVVMRVTFQEVAKVLLSYQFKFRRQLEADDASASVDYRVAQINNFNRCYEYTVEMETLAAKTFDAVTLAGLMIQEVLDGFQSLVVFSRALLVDYCFSVLDEDVCKLFTKSWHEEEVVEVFIATLNDYFRNDIQGKLIDVYFRKLAVECLDRVVGAYVAQLLYGKNRVPFTQRTAERLRYDAGRLSTFFTTWQVRDKFVATRLQVLTGLADIVGAPVDALSAALERLIRDAPDVHADVIEILLTRRADLPKKHVKGLLTQFNRALAASGPRVAPSSGIFHSLRKECKDTQ